VAEPEFKPPMLTSAAQRRVEGMAERVDTWNLANRMIREAGEWESKPDPLDVMALANYLSGMPGSD